MAPESATAVRSELIDVADLPAGGQLRLIRYGDEFEIMFDDEQLMGSWVGGSEEALATLACARLGAGGNILIGGLGMGFTLKAALGVLPANATVMVAELVPQVVEWANGRLAHLFAGALDDPRVTLLVRDVHDVIRDSPAGFDAILLDVDNGPDGLVSPGNDRLYCNWGVRSAHAALRPGGVLAIWSAYADHIFVERLQQAGFAVEEVVMDADGVVQSPGHTIWLARRAD